MTPKTWNTIETTISLGSVWALCAAFGAAMLWLCVSFP